MKIGLFLANSYWWRNIWAGVILIVIPSFSNVSLWLRVTILPSFMPRFYMASSKPLYSLSKFSSSMVKHACTASLFPCEGVQGLRFQNRIDVYHQNWDVWYPDNPGEAIVKARCFFRIGVVRLLSWQTNLQLINYSMDNPSIDKKSFDIMKDFFHFK